MLVDHDRVAMAFTAGAAFVERAVHAPTGDRVPGAVFGVVTSGGFRQVLVSGVADAVTGRATTVDTPFCMASTTKPMAATLLGDLLERRAIALDDPIGDHLGVAQLPSGLLPFRPPTVREVASHTAGLGVHARFFHRGDDEPEPVDRAVHTLARPMFEPGRDWRYSNLGYGVLQVALAQAYGADFATAMTDRVFAPLGMEHSSIGGWTGPDGAAVRHAGDGTPYPAYVTDHPAASEAWCSIDDLLAFGHAHAASTLLRPDTHALLAAPVAPRQPTEGAYALGWIQREFGPDKVSVLLHAGGMGGVSAHLAVVPELGLAVAGAANAKTGALSDALMSVLAAIVPHYHRPPDERPGPFQPPDASTRGRWTGELLVDDATRLPVVVDVPAEGTITVTVEGETVDMHTPRCADGRLTGYVFLTQRPRNCPPSAAWELALVASGDEAHGSFTAHHYDPAGGSRVGNSVSYAVLVRRT